MDQIPQQSAAETAEGQHKGQFGSEQFPTYFAIEYRLSGVIRVHPHLKWALRAHARIGVVLPFSDVVAAAADSDTVSTVALARIVVLIAGDNVIRCAVVTMV